MIASNEALAAFAMVAGVAPDKLNLLIRTILLSLTFLWAAWCVYGEIQFFKHHDVDAIDLIRKLSRLLLLVSFMVALVFI